MKKILLVFLLSVLPFSLYAEKPDYDTQRIKLQLQSFAVLADQNAFEYLGRIFDEKVLVDYRSAFGGQANRVGRSELMRQWAALLPGFDLTRHDLSNIHIDIVGDKASASANIIASHYLGDEGFWQISGRYRFELEQKKGDWLITSLTLNAGDETGSRDVLGKAGKNARARLAARARATVRY